MDPEFYRNLQSNLLLFYIGSTRKASSVLSDQKANLIADRGRFENQKK